MMVGLAVVAATGCDVRARDAATVDGVSIPAATVNEIARDDEFLSAAQLGTASADESTVDGETARSVLNFLIVNQVVHDEIKAAGGAVGSATQKASTPKMSKAGAAAADERAAITESFQAVAATPGGVKRFTSLADGYARRHRGEFGQACLVGIAVPAASVGAVRAALASGQTPAQLVAAGAQAQEIGADGKPQCVDRSQAGPDALQQLLAVKEGATTEVTVASQQGNIVLLVTVVSKKSLDDAAAVDELVASLKQQSGLSTWVQMAFEDASVTVDSRYGTGDPATLSILAPMKPTGSVAALSPVP